MFIFREEYYRSRLQPIKLPDEEAEKYQARVKKWLDNCEEVYGITEVIIAKQRHGPIGTIKLQFSAETTKFEDFIATDHLPARR
jgi:replicative DNA helicase